MSMCGAQPAKLRLLGLDAKLGATEDKKQAGDHIAQALAGSLPQMSIQKTRVVQPAVMGVACPLTGLLRGLDSGTCNLANGQQCTQGGRTGRRHWVMAGSSPQMASIKMSRLKSSIWCFSHQWRCVFTGSGHT